MTARPQCAVRATRNEGLVLAGAAKLRLELHRAAPQSCLYAAQVQIICIMVTWEIWRHREADSRCRHNWHGLTSFWREQIAWCGQGPGSLGDACELVAW